MKADRKKVSRLLKTARGQIDGIIKMVEEDRYCIDVFNQILATRSLLNSVNKEIIHGHLENCVKQSFEEGKEEEKIAEVLMIMDKLSK
ncbi:metal-sensing transcriptional repressor [Anaerosinus massiliensis]|uniref:metal-sensing transcriptional repressor n=1 Tax=Massilibacillus massiliensis TaxID=1806837 RepID=UPI000B169BC6|nr:metal-sensing transcriptional repressor [Massilibacillus massiliensis]